ncbi:hypothetical protein QR680_000974 [Steinernema hermaphroditum]|uniref:PXA domain-containing protein n=1 Tax=Steinernema hermaphroditum TaxID=289476 RepID=A0AA39LF18_9BILA|nr:hypothetical protein QR680_000974 [Steinernema hermaphroditum]
MERTDPNSMYIGGALALIAFFYAIGFSLCTVLFCFLAVCTGAYVASSLFADTSNEPNTVCLILENIFRERLKRPQKRSSLVESMIKVGKQPWDGLELPEPVNVAVEDLIEQLVDNYINSWYQTEISNDHAFVNEIRYQIRYASAVLFRRLNDIDLAETILNDIVPVATLPPLMIETKILESFADVHCVMTSRQAECDYLRSLADFLVGQLIDESRVAGRSLDEESPVHNVALPSLRNKKWPSHSCRHFLRELLVYSFFIPVLDLLADPDTINMLLVLLFDPEPMADYPITKSKRVPFLYGLTKCAMDDTPESLIQLKLSEIVRDPRHLQMFSMYLKDSKGPTNVLKFLLQADDVHSRMQQIGFGNKVDDIVKGELRADISTLYDNFAKPSSPEYVQLPEDLLEEFREAVESDDLLFLDRVVEKTYQLLYQRLQFDHVVTFCQSECYLGYLCGSPPEAVEELIESNMPDKSAAGRRQAFSVSSQSSFSFSQFRNRLWSVIIPTSTDGSLDECGSDISSGYYSTSSRGIEVGDEAACVVGSLAPHISAVRYPSSSPENFSVPAIDVTMADDAPDEGFIVPAVNAEPGKPQSGELICEKTRDMSRWRVQIPRIEPRRDTNGRTMFVYIISVERSDIEGELTPRKWEVVRRYHEFYILESKLNEFHGDLIKTDPLPPKRTLRTKNREFIESVRLQFERNLQLLTQQSVLKRSDLLAVFLSGEEEITNNAVFSMSNTWRVVKKVPGKFSREKGQHMKPFLLHMMAVVLAPADVQKAEFGSNGKKSESSSISSISFEQSVNKPKQIPLNSIYGNNCPSSCATSTLFEYVPWTGSICHALMFLIQRCFNVSSAFSCLLLSILRFFRSIIDKIIINLLASVLGYSLNDSNVVQLVHLLQKALFTADEGSSTEQEKVMRAELAQRRTVEYLQDQLPSAFVQGVGKKRFRQSVQNLFSALQHPRLNKQLSYVLIDLLVRKLFPEFRN